MARTTSSYETRLKRSLSRKGWEFHKLEHLEDGTTRLYVRVNTEDAEVLHDWRTYWGFIGFATHKDDVKEVMFYTM